MIVCPIRKKELKADPEEVVRIHLIHQLIDELGFPPSMISVEKSINQLANSPLVFERRIDVLCYGKKENSSLFPLLLIECKADSIGDRVIRQVVGYNQYIGAPFIAVANRSEAKMGWLNPQSKQYTFISGISTYSSLLQSLSL